MKTLFVSFAFLFASTAILAQTAKKEYIVVKETGYYWDTKIDSSSEYSAINASRIVVFNGTIPISKNIGREINFAVTNEKGEKKTVNSKVAGTATYNGEEKYMVELTFDYNQTEKKTKVILADLSSDEFKLIAGKNWSK
jgi:hypothetical protein